MATRLDVDERQLAQSLPRDRAVRHLPREDDGAVQEDRTLAVASTDGVHERRTQGTRGPRLQTAVIGPAGVLYRAAQGLHTPVDGTRGQRGSTGAQ